MKISALRLGLVAASCSLVAMCPSRVCSAAPGAPASPTAATIATGPCVPGDPSIAAITGWHLGFNEGVVQPLASGATISACEVLLDLTLESSHGAAGINVIAWNPAALLPDPGTVALRSHGFSVSDVAYRTLRAEFVPPIVTAGVSRLADPAASTFALHFFGTGPSNTVLSAGYDPDAAGSLPPAVAFPLGSAPHVLPGNHPVLAHWECSGNDAIAGLRVGQAVMRTDGEIGLDHYEILQRLRVPSPLRLSWVELAGGAQIHSGNGALRMSIFTGLDPSTPPVWFPAPIADAWTPVPATPQTWVPMFDTDAGVTLLPGQDYWLYVQTGRLYPFHTRTLTGGESQDFTSTIGPLWSRDDPEQPWTTEAGRVLDFRLIGTPTTAIDAPPAAPRVSGLQLAAAPNPARGFTTLSWSGVRGRLRIDVYDVRGRRLGEAPRLAGATGRWTWAGTLADGRTLDAGVYLLRATDGSGATADRRVVLLR